MLNAAKGLLFCRRLIIKTLLLAGVSKHKCPKLPAVIRVSVQERRQ
jgi:hypothetical protein